MNILLKYLIILIGVLILPITTFAVPQMPHIFYGDASLNSVPLQVGAVINARVNENLVGSVIVQNVGEYGGPDAYDQKLVVQGDINNGANINFFVSGIKAEETASFDSGKIENLDLSFIYSGGSISNNTVQNNGDNDVSLGSEESGIADLPLGAKNISLTNNSKLDLSEGVKTENNKKSVKIKSSTEEDIEIINTEKSNIKVTIPNETIITADTSWDGKMQSPKNGDSSGTPPSGFQIGDTVVEVGSSDVNLEFDKAVKLTLEDVTGFVAYKAVGDSSWTKITTQCNSVINHSNISAPDECYYQTGNDTVIWTYHFTTFAELNEESTNTGTTNNSSSYNPPPQDEDEETEADRADINNDGDVNIFDFNQLMVQWGNSGFGYEADINEDNEVDILDFNLLMVYWTE